MTRDELIQWLKDNLQADDPVLGTYGGAQVAYDFPLAQARIGHVGDLTVGLITMGRNPVLLRADDEC